MHGKYPFPEATATTEVLVSGEKGGNQAKLLAVAGLVGGLYDFVVGTFGLWTESVSTRICTWGQIAADKFKVVFGLNTTAAVLGLGYIIGLKYALIITAGSCLVWFVIVPVVGSLAEAMDPAALAPLLADIDHHYTETPIDEYMVYYQYKDAVSDGLPRGFATLSRKVEAYSESMLRLARTGFPYMYPYKQEACEDIVQDVFLNLWEKRKEMAQVVSLKSFLLKSVQNNCISYFRHRHIEDKYAGLQLSESGKVSHETEHYILYSELNSRLQEALEQLSPMQRQCFEMNRMQGMKQAEVARELKVSLRTVELRIAEALKILKQCLKDYFVVCLLLIH